MQPSAKAALALAAAAAIAVSGVAASKDADKPTAKQRAAVLQAVVDCRAVTDAMQRLACFDAAAAKLDEAETKGQVVVVDREQAREVRREIFGLQLPSLDIFARSAGKEAAALSGEDDIDRITEKVRRAWRGQDGRWMVELESGAVWRQTDNANLPFDPRQGSTAEIRKGSLGSYFMKIDGGRQMRAARDR